MLGGGRLVKEEGARAIFEIENPFLCSGKGQVSNDETISYNNHMGHKIHMLPPMVLDLFNEILQSFDHIQKLNETVVGTAISF